MLNITSWNHHVYLIRVWPELISQFLKITGTNCDHARCALLQKWDSPHGKTGQWVLLFCRSSMLRKILMSRTSTRRQGPGCTSGKIANCWMFWSSVRLVKYRAYHRISLQSNCALKMTLFEYPEVVSYRWFSQILQLIGMVYLFLTSTHDFVWQDLIRWLGSMIHFLLGQAKGQFSRANLLLVSGELLYPNGVFPI